MSFAALPMPNCPCFEGIDAEAGLLPLRLRAVLAAQHAVAIMRLGAAAEFDVDAAIADGTIPEWELCPMAMPLSMGMVATEMAAALVGQLVTPARPDGIASIALAFKGKSPGEVMILRDDLYGALKDIVRHAQAAIDQVAQARLNGKL